MNDDDKTLETEIAETPIVKTLTRAYLNGFIPEPIFNDLLTQFADVYKHWWVMEDVHEATMQRIASGTTRAFEKDGKIYLENVKPAQGVAA